MRHLMNVIGMMLSGMIMVMALLVCVWCICTVGIWLFDGLLK